MKISRVEASCYKVFVPVPFKKEPLYRDVVLVEVETDNGLIGYGMGDVLAVVVRKFINEYAAPYLLGMNPLETEKIWEGLHRQFNNRTQTGIWSQGVSVIDIALWDLKGKHFQEPVARLLGGASNKVPAYVTFGLDEYTREQLIKAAGHMVEQGYDKLKMVVGDSWSLEEDVARVKAVREVIGPDVQLMIDANCMLSLPEAMELCKRVEQYDIFWFEEPVYRNDFRLLAELKRHTSIPLAAGQQIGNQWQHRELIVNNAVDICQMSVPFVGGYTEALKVANLARAFNIPVANGGAWPFYNQHLQAAVVNGIRVEFHWVIWKIGEAVFEGVAQPSQGWIEIPETPGLGLEPRFDVLEKCRLE